MKWGRQYKVGKVTWEFLSFALRADEKQLKARLGTNTRKFNHFLGDVLLDGTLQSMSLRGESARPDWQPPSPAES